MEIEKLFIKYMANGDYRSIAGLVTSLKKEGKTNQEIYNLASRYTEVKYEHWDEILKISFSETKSA